DLVRLARVHNRYLSVLRDVQILQHAAAVRGSDADRRAVRPGYRPPIVLCQPNDLLELRRQVVVGKLDLCQLEFCILDRCVYDAGRRVRVEQAGVENENCDERREPELAGLEDDVQIPEITPERALRFVAYEL